MRITGDGVWGQPKDPAAAIAVLRRAIDLGSAAVLVVMGVLLLTNNLTLLSAGLTQLVPNWPSPSL